MHLILLLLSSLLLGFVNYYAVRRVGDELRTSFVVLLVYRYVFFIIQSFVFYAVYQNQLDSLFYHRTLFQLVETFTKFPTDSVHFFTGDYAALHVSDELQLKALKSFKQTYFQSLSNQL